jgi:hypothetical protein
MTSIGLGIEMTGNEIFEKKVPKGIRFFFLAALFVPELFD